jgi:hypothetical protein
MHRRVAARAPASSLSQSRCMRCVADINFARRPLDLRMAFQAKIQVALDQQFSVHRTVRVMTDRATLPQSLVLEYKWPCLFTMTLRAVFIEPRHRQTAGRSAAGATCRFENVASVRIVALHAIHLSLDHRMMLRHSKFCLRLQMTLEAGSRIFSRVDDEFAASSTGFDMLAPRPVAGFAAGLPAELRIFDMHARVRAGRKNSGDIRMTLGAGLIADVSRSRNIRRCNYGSRERRTRDGHKQNEEQCADSI